MKVCPNCGSSFDDSMRFCVQCGTGLEDAPTAPAEEVTPAAEAPAAPAEEPVVQQPVYDQQAQYAPPAPGYVPPYAAPVAPLPNPDDHTGEMEPEDIQDNKLYAILVYLLGPLGIIIALLKDKQSKFLQFHIKLSIKYLVVETILIIASCTFILSIPAAIMLAIIAVLEIITFVQVCKGQAKDPAIIKSIKFLN